MLGTFLYVYKARIYMKENEHEKAVKQLEHAFKLERHITYVMDVYDELNALKTSERLQSYLK